jgi:hypothetical protein
MKDARSWQYRALALLLVVSSNAMADPPRELDGVPIEDSVTVSGTKLVLNGAAIQRRGFFKTNTCALYLPEKRNTLDGVVKLAGPKRVQLVILRDMAGWLISRQFQSDVAANATEDESRAVGTDMDAIAAGYAKIDVLHKGDVVVVDWTPGQGIASSVNGKSMGPPVNNELLFDVSLRPVMGKLAPSDLRDQLLGVISSP